MRLWFHHETPTPRIDCLLLEVGKRLDISTVGTHSTYLGDLVLTCPIPPGYTRRMNRWADRLRMRVGKRGEVFELAEVSDGQSGGWMASCIPVALLATALAAWLEANQPAQLYLFA